MGRKSTHKIGNFYGKLEVLEIISNNKQGRHVSLRCLCHHCNKEIIMRDANKAKKMNSCGCQQRNSTTWKSKGPKSLPWQLPNGMASLNRLESDYKKGANHRNLVYELTREQFVNLVVGECVYCGNKLTQTKKGQGKTSGDFHFTGIDRIDSTIGYVENNCVSCCWMCNNMKSKYSKEEFISHVKKIYKNIKKTF